jgi:tetratricopeptide (TPR) repeat protein
MTDVLKDMEAKAFKERRLGLLILENKEGAALAAGVPHLRAAAEIWTQLNWPAKRAEVLLDLGRLHTKSGDFQDAAQTFEEALAIFQTLDDERAIEAASGAGEAHLACGHASRALPALERAAALADRLNDHMRIAAAQLAWGRALAACQRGDEAATAAHKALGIYTSYKKHSLRASCHEVLAEAHAARGDRQAMADAYGLCVAIHLDELAKTQDGIAVLMRWAERERDADRPRESLAVLHQVKVLQEKASNHGGVAQVLRRIGVVHQRAGAENAAQTAFREALMIAEATGDQDGLSRTLLLLGLSRLKTADHDGGLADLERSAQVAQVSDNHDHEAEALAAQARELRRRGETERALVVMQRWVEVLKALGDREDVLKVLGEIADVHAESGATDEAEVHLRRLIQVCSRPEDRAVRGRARQQLGGIVARRGDHRESYLHYSQALDDFGPDCERSLAARLLWHMGNACLHGQDPTSGLTHLHDALRRLEGTEAHQARAKVLVGIGNAKAMLGQDAEAKSVFEEAALLCERQGDMKSTHIIRRVTRTL